MRDHVASSGNVGHGLKALYAAKSGISHGLVVLEADDKEFDSLKDDWTDAEKLAALSVMYKDLLGGSAFNLKIDDLSGRIPINLLVENDMVKEAFTRLLNHEQFDLDGDTINTILDATMDWIDEDSGDELYRLNGAENDYYQSLDNPYLCKNGPLDNPDELLFVKGMTPELFFGNEEKPGIGKHIGMHSSEEPKINMNTADPMVLGALSNDYDGDTLAGFREDATDAELESGEWYKDKINKNLANLVSTTSEFFQIVSEGQFGDTKKKIVAVVKRSRDKEDIQTLSWRIE